MWQTSFLEEDFSPGIINVASIPKISPFRYPGGKTWFVPYIRRWLDPAIRQKQRLVPVRPTRFIEPFLGGGSISLTVAAEHLVATLIMAEIDEDVAAVWQTALCAGDAAWLAQQIVDYALTAENVTALLGEQPAGIHERALQTIVRNRVNHGGILAPGAGQLKAGENGKGLLSRWYPVTLAQRIRRIAAFGERMTFVHGDGLALLADHVDDTEAVFFIDPPYTIGKNGKRAGKRLYTYNELDHEKLFTLASQLQGDFLMTYDDAQEVHELARMYGFATRLVPMKTTHHTYTMELLIGRNLDWLNLPQP